MFTLRRPHKSNSKERAKYARTWSLAWGEENRNILFSVFLSKKVYLIDFFLFFRAKKYIAGCTPRRRAQVHDKTSIRILVNYTKIW